MAAPTASEIEKKYTNGDVSKQTGLGRPVCAQRMAGPDVLPISAPALKISAGQLRSDRKTNSVPGY